MAKKRGRRSGSNKSQQIRDTYESLGADARPRDVLHALQSQGIDVSRALVTNVLKRHGAGPARKPGRPAGKATAKKAGAGRPGRPPKAAGDVSLGAVMAAKKLVGEVGSLAAARKALDTLAETQL